VADVIARLFAFVAAGVALIAASATHLAQGQPVRMEATEASVKAAFLYKFPGYVDWPASAFASPDAPFVFGVMGQEEVATELERLVAGRQWSGHPMSVRRVTGDDLKGLQVVFVGHGVNDRMAAVVHSAQLPGLLVVTENDKGLAAGAAINLVVHDERVGFEVAPDAADHNGLRISSRMLAVAKRVVQR
jgi:hypothetical protein